ncbi:MAG: LysR family transcriptional regulator [Vescimonas sp.]
MNNTDMETFWAVLEHGTLTAAANALFITQPTLTNRIQSLETEVGAQLFHRKKGVRHIELTEAGQRFLPLAYRWQALLDETRGVAETASREFLRIGAVFSSNQYILPAAYRRFLRRKLPVALWVQTLRGSGYDGAQTVARRELEMALMDGDGFFHPQLDVRPLCREETMVACSPNSPYGDVVSPKELDPANEIVVSWRKGVQDWRDHWFGLTTKPILYADSMQVVDSFLGNEMMWAIVPATAAQVLEKEGKARICRCTDPPPDRMSYLVTRRGETLSEAAQLLLEDICTEMRNIKGLQIIL